MEEILTEYGDECIADKAVYTYRLKEVIARIHKLHEADLRDFLKHILSTDDHLLRADIERRANQYISKSKGGQDNE